VLGVLPVGRWTLQVFHGKICYTTEVQYWSDIQQWVTCLGLLFADPNLVRIEGQYEETKLLAQYGPQNVNQYKANK
jgi:hypothetical protein